MATIEPGQLIGSYRIERELGSGGFGAVYQAAHAQIGRQAAIKVLHKRFANNPTIAQRFLNEARAVNIIDHPNVVSIYDMGQLDDGTPYMVMEYLDGQPLTARMRWGGGRLGHATLRFARQIASALAAAHDRGIVHRDLKPDNVMVVNDPETPTGERIKVLDFGIAKLEESGPPGHGQPAGPLTGQAEGPMGTPVYMSPEQCRGGTAAIDGRSDVYALGIILYRLLAGRLPFVGHSFMEVIGMHLYSAPPPLVELDPMLPPALADLVHTMLAKEPNQRPTMHQVAMALDQLDPALRVVPIHQRMRRRRAILTTAGIALLAAIAGGAAAFALLG